MKISNITIMLAAKAMGFDSCPQPARPKDDQLPLEEVVIHDVFV